MRLETTPIPRTRTRPSAPLPFVVRPARGTSDLQQVSQIRAAAYGRHLPGFAASLQAPEKADRGPGAVVLLAQSKHDGRPLGTVRLQIDRACALPVEASVILPSWLHDQGPLIEATRLAVEASADGAQARNALLKAAYLYACAAGAGWILATARRPLDRLYEGLLFRDVFQGGAFLPMGHVGNLPHRLLALPVREAHALATERRHPLAALFFETDHPDLVIDASLLHAPWPAAA